jgi:hypothetical protein
VLSQRLTLALCFSLIGWLWVASLWVDLYRLVPVAFVLCTALAWRSSTLPVTIARALAADSPVFV